MRILFLAHRLPYPPNKGEKIRAFHELKYLGERHSVDLFCFADSEAELQYKKYLEPFCRQMYVEVRSHASMAAGAARSFWKGLPLSCGLFWSQRLRTKIREALFKDSYDVIFVFCSAMAQLVPKECATPIVMDFVDIDSAKWTQYAHRTHPPMSWIYAREGRTLARHEVHWAEKSVSVVVTTAQEAKLLVSAGVSRVDVVENGVEIPRRSAKNQNGISGLDPYALFVGTMDYLPNADAVEHFSRDILTLVQAQIPELKFVIVGRNPTSRVRQLARLRGVHVTGEVPSVDEYLAHCAVVVAPFRIAQGVQNKLLEALAAGKPIVCSPGPAAAIGAINGENLLIGENPEDFAAAVIGLLQNAELRNRFCKGVDFVRANFDWSKNLRRLEELLLQAAGVGRQIAKPENAMC